jgi:integrase
MNKHKVRPYRDSQRPHLKFVVNTKEGGKRKRSFFETKGAAQTFAGQKDIELLNTGMEGAQFPSALRVMASQAAATLSPFGKTILDAVNFYLPHLQASNRTCTINALVDELIEAKKADGASERYLGDLRSRLGQFTAGFDGKNVSEFTSSEIDHWLRSLGVASTTRNNFRRVLIVAFNFAVDRGYCITNPAKKSAKAKEITKAPGILNVGQAARLLESASADVLPYIAIGLFAGLRRAEIERLDWSEIDFDSGLIEVTAQNSKTAERRHVTMQPNLREWLLPLRKHKGNVTSGETLRKGFDEARVAAGIIDWPDNALRHSFASYHMAHFRNAAETALQLGHIDSRITFRHYRELVKPKEAERYWNIKPCAGAKKVVTFAA